MTLTEIKNGATSVFEISTFCVISRKGLVAYREALK